MDNEYVGRDLYFRRVYAGKPGPVLYARVWDADTFVASQAASGASEKKKEDRYTVELAGQSEYRAELRR